MCVCVCGLFLNGFGICVSIHNKHRDRLTFAHRDFCIKWCFRYKRMEINNTMYSDLADRDICVHAVCKQKACCSVICWRYPWGSGIATPDYLQASASGSEVILQWEMETSFSHFYLLSISLFSLPIFFTHYQDHFNLSPSSVTLLWPSGFILIIFVTGPLELGCHFLSEGGPLAVPFLYFVTRWCVVIGWRKNQMLSKWDLPRLTLTHPQTHKLPVMLLCSGLGLQFVTK